MKMIKFQSNWLACVVLGLKLTVAVKKVIRGLKPVENHPSPLSPPPPNTAQAYWLPSVYTRTLFEFRPAWKLLLVTSVLIREMALASLMTSGSLGVVCS